MAESNLVGKGRVEADTFWCRDHHGRSYSFSEFAERVRIFHGYSAPGVLIAGKMVQIILERLPNGILFDALCETGNCLPDAVQLLTACTIGNGWMHILDMKKFALTLFDKNGGKGYRAWIDHEKMASWKEIRDWFFKTKPKGEQDTALLLQQIQEAGAGILRISEVTVHPRFLVKSSIGKRAICPVCQEIFPASHGRCCLACQGQTPYATRGSQG